MDVFVTQKVTRKVSTETRDSKVRKSPPAVTQKTKFPTKPKRGVRETCDRYNFDFTDEDEWAGWDYDDDDNEYGLYYV